jgi:hypothetical protein
VAPSVIVLWRWEKIQLQEFRSWFRWLRICFQICDSLTPPSLQELHCKVSLSLDAWTSSNGHAFLAIVMHYISNDWRVGMFP